MAKNLHRRCAKCGKTRSEDLAFSFYRFPKPGIYNIAKAQAWAKFCWPNKDFISIESLQSIYNSNKVLCARHFSTSQFHVVGKRRLITYAVPTLVEQHDLPMNEKKYQIDNQTNKMMDQKPSTSRIPLTQIENVNELNAQITTNYFLQQPGEIITTPKPTTKNDDYAAVTPKSIETHLLPHSSPKKRKGMLRSSTVSKISDMSPKELKLYNMCQKRIKEIMRLRKTLKSKKIKNVIKTLTEEENVQKLCNLNMSHSFAILLQSQIKNWPKKPRGRRYSLNQKIMALVIYKRSPACYRLLRRIFALPCQSSLNKLLNRLPLKPGINGHIFSALKKMAQNYSDENNICILSFDEMSIKKHLYYNSQQDEVQGFQDHGHHGKSNGVATKALVFMLSGIKRKWKQPIAFYFSNTLNADRLTVFLKEVLKECFDAHMNVVATVCDLSTVNLKVLKTLGATTQEPFFTLYGREIVSILDPPHLLKCTRNLFMKHDIECSTDIQNNENPVKGVAKWSHIEAFYKLDKNNANFVFAPALTENHLHPNLKQQMRVKLAAQIFSHSVAAGILAKIASNELPSEAHATATLLKNFDNLFDSVNADTPGLRRGKKYSTIMTKTSLHLALFFEMRKFISSMKFLNNRTMPPSQEGWIHTLNAIEKLYDNLKKNNVNKLSTRRLNQDPLENFFGCVRYNCGSNTNPTIQQFIAGIKTAIVSNLRHSGQKTNCENDTAQIADNLISFLTEEESIIEKFDDMTDIEYDIDFGKVAAGAVDEVEKVTPESQACAYVCGFIFKKLKNKNCVHCKNALLTVSENAIHIFTGLKEYETNLNTSTSLNYVNENFVISVQALATIINKYLNVSAWKPHLKKNMLLSLNQFNFDFLYNCRDHLNTNIEHIKNCTFHICLNRYITLKNREMIKDDKQKVLVRKLKIFRNK